MAGCRFAHGLRLRDHAVNVAENRQPCFLMLRSIAVLAQRCVSKHRPTSFETRASGQGGWAGHPHCGAPQKTRSVFGDPDKRNPGYEATSLPHVGAGLKPARFRRQNEPVRPRCQLKSLRFFVGMCSIGRAAGSVREGSMANDSKQPTPSIGANGFLWLLVVAAGTYFVTNRPPLEGSRPPAVEKYIPERRSIQDGRVAAVGRPVRSSRREVDQGSGA
jgi:hypothetical protein